MQIPDEVRAVIELFEKQLAKVSFPDVDAAVLRREAEGLAAEAAKVAQARAALDAAIATSNAKLEALTELARRATAYATIYSEARPERSDLAEAIRALTAPAVSPAAAAPKRRGRPRKQAPELFARADDPAPVASPAPASLAS
jgi:hypothetical protein